jgi:hypothetical protein
VWFSSIRSGSWAASRSPRSARDGRPERHLAFVGVRRIGKSRLIEHYRDTASVAVAYGPMDSAATTLAVFLQAMVRATVNALALRRGRAEVGKSADDLEVVARAAALDGNVVERVLRAPEATAERRPDGQRLLEVALTFPEAFAEATDQPFLIVADEVQHVVGLAGDAPFGGRTAGVARRTDGEDRGILLGSSARRSSGLPESAG